MAFHYKKHQSLQKSSYKITTSTSNIRCTEFPSVTSQFPSLIPPTASNWQRRKHKKKTSKLKLFLFNLHMMLGALNLKWHKIVPTHARTQAWNNKIREIKWEAVWLSTFRLFHVLMCPNRGLFFVFSSNMIPGRVH